jgi:hypothetical protein
MHTGSLAARQSLFWMFSRSEGWDLLRCAAVSLCGSHHFERKSCPQTLRGFSCFVQIVWRNVRHTVVQPTVTGVSVFVCWSSGAYMHRNVS